MCTLIVITILVCIIVLRVFHVSVTIRSNFGNTVLRWYLALPSHHRTPRRCLIWLVVRRLLDRLLCRRRRSRLYPGLNLVLAIPGCSKARPRPSGKVPETRSVPRPSQPHIRPKRRQRSQSHLRTVRSSQRTALLVSEMLVAGSNLMRTFIPTSTRCVLRRPPPLPTLAHYVRPQLFLGPSR